MSPKKAPRTRNHTLQIESMAQFVETACRYRDDWISGTEYLDPWFRGQRDADWPLEPNIFRLDLLNDEDNLRAEFQRRAPQYISETRPQDYWGWYFLMQHYGAPTRLLDWTDSALVALFFALNDDTYKPQEDERNAVVWMLDPWWLNRTVLNEDSIMLPDFDSAQKYLSEPFTALDKGDTRISPALPVSIDPPFIARRVAAQKSHFTIFGHQRDGLTELGKSADARLVKMVIAKEVAPRLRADLMTLGLTDTSIYPDLRGLANEVTHYHLGLWPPDPCPE